MAGNLLPDVMEDVKKYKLLKNYGELIEGEFISTDEWDATPEEIADLVEDGTVEEVIDDSTPASNTPETGPEVPPTPETAPEGEKELLPAGDPNVKAKYLITGAVSIIDAQGQKQGEYAKTVYVFPEDVGNMYVNQGVAEKLETIQPSQK